MGRSRQGTDAAVSSKIPPSRWPDRRSYLLLAVFFTAVAVYGSLVPLRFRPLALHEAVEQFRSMPFRAPGATTRADWAANVLLFIPFGYLWLGAWLLDSRRTTHALLAVPAVVLSASGLSATLEFIQLWLPDRSVSQNDVVAETIGALVGVSLWCASGQAITDWLRLHTGSRRTRNRIDWLLEAYVVGLVVWSAWPLDLTISVTDLAQKYRDGLISLVPFSGIAAGPAMLFTIGRDVAVFVPVGMLAATWLTPRQRPVRSMGTSVLLGAVVVLAIEAVRLLVVPRFTSIDHVILGTLGVGIGGWAMHRWRGGRPQPKAPATAGPLRPTWVWLGLAAGYTLLLLAVSCAPWEPIADPQQLKVRYHGFWQMPVARLRDVTEFETLWVLVATMLAWMPLGGMLALVVAHHRLPAAVRRTLLALLLLAAAGMATAIEMLQVFLPARVPDVTDVILSTVGAAIGMVAAGRFVRARDKSAGPCDH